MARLSQKTTFFLLSMITTSFGWMNDYDGKLEYICPNGTIISGIRSVHNNWHEDRLFELTCRATIGIPTKCHWSGYINSLDEFFSFQCANEGVIHGMRSINDNGHEDRRWDFYCCERNGFIVYECMNTPHTQWDAYFSVDVPDNSVMRGVTSVHDNGHEDREYVFEICQLTEYTIDVPVVG